MNKDRQCPEDRFRKRESERALADEFNRRQEAYRIASVRFHDIAASVPSGIPAPDCNLRITKANEERARAYSALQIALERWKNFVAKSIIPEDMTRALLRI